MDTQQLLISIARSHKFYPAEDHFSQGFNVGAEYMLFHNREGFPFIKFELWHNGTDVFLKNQKVSLCDPNSLDILHRAFKTARKSVRARAWLFTKI